MSSRSRPSILLPLMHGHTGRFLGIYSPEGRWMGRNCFGSRVKPLRFTGITNLPDVPEGAWFRNETMGITYRFDGDLYWDAVKVDEPDACRYCDTPRRRHGQSLNCAQPGIGWHSWTPPTDRQRLTRMRWRRTLRMRPS